MPSIVYVKINCPPVDLCDVDRNPARFYADCESEERHQEAISRDRWTGGMFQEIVAKLGWNLKSMDRVTWLN